MDLLILDILIFELKWLGRILINYYSIGFLIEKV